MSTNLYTDEQLIHATDMHIDNVRKLVTWGAIKPAKGGRGRGNVRMWDASTVRHIACVSALFKGGLSLKLAHTLVYLDVLSDLFLSIIDPVNLAMNAGDKDGWFNPTMPLDPHDDYDFRIFIADGQFVFAGSDPSLMPYPKGILADGGTVFCTDIDFEHFQGTVPDDGSEMKLRPKWEIRSGHFEVDPSSLAWRYDNALDRDVTVDTLDWEQAYGAAVSMTIVNLSLACKIAMRRLLDIPVFFSTPARVNEQGGAAPS